MGYRFECPTCDTKIIDGPSTEQVLANSFKCYNCCADLTGFIDADERERTVMDFIDRIERLEEKLGLT